MNAALSLQPDMSMADLLEVYPGARRALFAKYHIGGCASCAFRSDETLAQVCARNGDLDVDAMIVFLQESQQRDEDRLLDPCDLKARLDAARLLDVRTREEHESVAIPGARLFTQDLLQEIMGGWAKETPIVIFDHFGGSTSLDAAAYLEGHGFIDVRALRGGIDAYSQEADRAIARYRLEMDDA